MSAKTCPACGFVVYGDVEKCPHCGTALVVAGMPAGGASALNTSRVLANWKTSVAASVFGLLAGGVRDGLIELGSSLSYDVAVLAFVASLIWAAISIWYAASFYPSLFRADCQRSSSSAAISFMNLFFGGILFGCLWNSNLTKRSKGISNVVYVVWAVLLYGIVTMMLAFS
ncbi:hypothetical protein GMI70_04640 [Eggerthellaceae bacterium zg-893]|nr:hypothetical protein [Eggerthellaceae bacterium zg-893]